MRARRHDVLYEAADALLRTVDVIGRGGQMAQSEFVLPLK